MVYSLSLCTHTPTNHYWNVIYIYIYIYILPFFLFLFLFFSLLSSLSLSLSLCVEYREECSRTSSLFLPLPFFSVTKFVRVSFLAQNRIDKYETHANRYRCFTHSRVLPLVSYSKVDSVFALKCMTHKKINTLL